jgi:regulator of replication initiation timing
MIDRHPRNRSGYRTIGHAVRDMGEIIRCWLEDMEELHRLRVENQELRAQLAARPPTTNTRHLSEP